jgi:glucose-6-phosphate 1-epimerase
MISTIDFKGLPALQLQAPDGARATVLLQGAQIISWQSADGIEQLFLSDKAKFEPGQPVRGGIPVVFPQFNERGALPRHGWARTTPWQLLSDHVGSNDALAVLGATDTPQTYDIWPHRYALELSLRISGTELHVELAVENTGNTTLSFTAALHTYLRVNHLDAVRLRGLERLRYQDAVNKTEQIEAGEPIAIRGEFDRVYYYSARRLTLNDASRHILIHSQGFPDVVVWNPGPQRCAELADMHPLGYQQMLCVESAAIGNAVQLQPGESWIGRQLIEAQAL